MKRINLFASIFAFVFSASVYASGSALEKYSSSLHPTFAANLLHPLTDITVVNASSSYIYAVVPNSPINDYVSPGRNDHIYNNDPNVWNTYLVLQDSYRSTFYSANVCRLAIVTVYGTNGHFTINNDTDLCN